MILVTGASGNVGRAVVDRLRATGVPVRVLTRRIGSAFPAEVEQVQGDLSQSQTLADALRGVDRLFLFTPPTGSGEVARLARAASVSHVVLLSSIATQKADPRVNPIAARHAMAEQAVRDSGVAWTFLRPDTFAANALDWAMTIRQQGMVRAPYRLSRRCPIHEQDIAAVAVQALLSPHLHMQQAYWLTGPTSITQEAQVQAISQATGRSLRFEELSREQALQDMTERLPAATAERLLDYLAKSVHTPPATTSTVQQLLGRPAMSFAQWAQDHVKAFMP